MRSLDGARFFPFPAVANHHYVMPTNHVTHNFSRQHFIFYLALVSPALCLSPSSSPNFPSSPLEPIFWFLVSNACFLPEPVEQCPVDAISRRADRPMQRSAFLRLGLQTFLPVKGKVFVTTGVCSHSLGAPAEKDHRSGGH